MRGSTLWSACLCEWEIGVNLRSMSTTLKEKRSDDKPSVVTDERAHDFSAIYLKYVVKVKTRK